MQKEPDHTGRTRNRKIPHANRPQPNLHGTPSNQDLSPNPESILSQNKRNRQSQIPHIINYHSAPILLNSTHFTTHHTEH
eukprot:389266-Pelagomonas_calceolata.AAC.1